MQPSCDWLSGLRAHIPGSYSIFYPPTPPSPSPLIAQPVSVLGIVPTHVQDLALGLVELHEVRMGPPLKPVKVPLDGIPSLWGFEGRVQGGSQGKTVSQPKWGTPNVPLHRVLIPFSCSGTR